MGGEELQWRVHGGVELAGVRVERRLRSGVWGWGNGERTRGTSCWGICSVAARERSSSGVLQRAIHGGGEVAASGELLLRGKARRAQREG